MKRKRLEEPPKSFRREQSSRLPFSRKPKPKKAVNVSVDAELLKVAKEIGVNISRVTEDALRRLTEGERARRLYEENKASIDAHNAHIERYVTLAENLYGPDAFDDPSS